MSRKAVVKERVTPSHRAVQLLETVCGLPITEATNLAPPPECPYCIDLSGSEVS